MQNLKNKIASWRDTCWFKILSMLIKLSIAALIIGVLVSRAEIKKENFSGLDMRWIIAAFAAVFAQNILTGIRWWSLMRSIGLKVPLFDGVSLTMQGLFYTLFIPGGSVSGDVVKAALIAGKTPDGGKFDAAFSVLIDRICGLCGLFVLSMLAAAVALMVDINISEGFRQMLWLILILAPVMLLAAAAAFRCDLILRISLIKKLYDFCDRISKGAISRIEAALAAYRPAWKTVIGWTLISGLIAFPMISLSVWCIANSCTDAGGPQENLAGSLLAGSVGELAGILPLTPGGIGVRDAVFAEIFKSCGLADNTAALIPIIFTALFVLASSIGAFFALYMLVVRRRSK